MLTFPPSWCQHPLRPRLLRSQQARDWPRSREGRGSSDVCTVNGQRTNRSTVCCWQCCTVSSVRSCVFARDRPAREHAQKRKRQPSQLQTCEAKHTDIPVTSDMRGSDCTRCPKIAGVRVGSPPKVLFYDGLVLRHSWNLQSRCSRHPATHDIMFHTRCLQVHTHMRAWVHKAHQADPIHSPAACIYHASTNIKLSTSCTS